jgi:hypothetical protein
MPEIALRIPPHQLIVPSDGLARCAAAQSEMRVGPLALRNKSGLNEKVRRTGLRTAQKKKFRILERMSRRLVANPTEEIFYMADTVKTTKATAKPRKTAVKKEKVAKTTKPTMPSRKEIEELARKYWAARGFQDGYAEQDWLRAEQELLKMAS